jgi:SAM-dependent methyltransferase
MTWYREWFGEEYLELYSYRDVEEARQQVEFFHEQFGVIEGPLLDLACGTGRHLNELEELGYRAAGCDLSFTLLSAGRAGHGPIPVVRADMRQLPFCSASMAGLVSFFTSFGYFASEEENMQVVREMSRVLEHHAPFLFDYLNVHRELEHLVRREIRETPKGKVLIERWFDKSDRSFNKRITIGQRHFLERVRGYDLDEISVMFNSCDMTIGSAFGDFDGRPYDGRG